jgi:hypothetical protein
MDADHVEASIKEWTDVTKELIVSEKTRIKDNPAAVTIAQGFRESLAEFNAYVPLIQALRCPGLRERHWREISDQLTVQQEEDRDERRKVSAKKAAAAEKAWVAAGADPEKKPQPEEDEEDFDAVLEKVMLRPEPNLTLDHLVQMGLVKSHDAMDLLSDTAELATKEYSLEQGLDRMSSEWRSVVLDMSEYGKTGTSILKGTDDLIALLDDHIVKTQTMWGSPFKGPFEERIKTWESKLKLMQDTLDEWLMCQQGWMYLGPIFGSEDIMKVCCCCCCCCCCCLP